MAWIPPNYKSKSASKDKGDDTFRFIKKKKRKGALGTKFTGFKKLREFANKHK